MSQFKGNERLELFGYEMIHLISIGKKEKLEEIIDRIKEGNLIHYLCEKYENEFITEYSTNQVYDINEWEQVIQSNYSYIERWHDVERKMGIENDQDGLLLVVFIILEIKANNYK